MFGHQAVNAPHRHHECNYAECNKHHEAYYKHGLKGEIYGTAAELRVYPTRVYHLAAQEDSYEDEDEREEKEQSTDSCKPSGAVWMERTHRELSIQAPDSELIRNGDYFPDCYSSGVPEKNVNRDDNLAAPSQVDEIYQVPFIKPRDY
jgi:hypothetical protein